MEYPIRVLHAVVNMNRGGAETLLMNLYRHMDRSKLQFDFLTSKTGEFDGEIKSLGGRVHQIPYINEIGHQGYRRELKQFFLHQKEYGIVHSHMDRMSGLVLRAARKAGVPIRIAHSHNTRSEGGIAARLYKWYAGLYINLCATHRFACSQTAAKWLFSGQENNTVLVKNGVNPEKYCYSPEVREAVRKELDISETKLIVGHVGRFNYQKNHSLLLDIFKSLLSKRPDSVLLMVGDGPLRKEMERKSENMGISEYVRFLGVRSDVERLMQAMDIFVFPSHHEGLPVTLVEAQGVGLPCIVSDAISPESNLGLVQYISNLSPREYVQKILETEHGRNRAEANQQLVRNGYDIRATARWLQSYYSEQREVKREETNRIYANV